MMKDPSKLEAKFREAEKRYEERLNRIKFEGDITKEKSRLTPDLEKRLKTGEFMIDEKLFIWLRDREYGKSWEKLYTDIFATLKAAPYVSKLTGLSTFPFPLSHRVREHLLTVSCLYQFEKKHKCNLADYLKKKQKKE